METIHEIDTIKIEKENAMRRYVKFRNIAYIIRTLELFFLISLIFIAISSVTSYIPTIVEFTTEFLRRISSLFFNPHFVFVICNLIVVTLLANSSRSPPIDADFDVELDVEKAAVVAVERKVYRRSQSAEIMEVPKAELQRSMTMPKPRQGRGEVSENAAVAEAEEEVLSDEEFNRRVEEFIERQRRFLSEESKILVISN